MMIYENKMLFNAMFTWKQPQITKYVLESFSYWIVTTLSNFFEHEYDCIYINYTAIQQCPILTIFYRAGSRDLKKMMRNIYLKN